MKLFEGKSPTERNKIIAAIVLGVSAVLALTYTFGGSFFGGRSKTTITVSASPTPTATRRSAETVSMPSREEENLIYTTMPVRYVPGDFYAPDAGRNIFAFYEPPPPTPFVPTPIPPPTPEIIITPTPTPVPPLLVGFVTPQSVYAGARTFRMEVNGDKFTPDSLIYLNGNQLPTTFVSPQQLVADVPSNLIANAGSLYVIVRTPDNRLYSNQIALNVQTPPTPQLQYIGMIARQRSNNDTAYFQEPSKPNAPPVGARLNDVVGGRFRLTSISAVETVFEDVNLGFKHRLALYRPTPGQSTGSNNPNQNPDLNPGRFQRGNPNLNNPNFNNPNPPGVPYTIQPGEIPGIPSNIPIYVPPTPNPNKETKDQDDDGN